MGSVGWEAKMRLTFGWRLVLLGLCCLATEGLLSSKTSSRLEMRLPPNKEALDREVNDAGEINVNDDSSEEEVDISLLEKKLEEQQDGTIPDALGAEGDSDLEDDGDVFWTESSTEIQNEMKEDSYFGAGDREDTELNLDLPDKYVERFEGDSGEHDTFSDAEEGESVPKDTAAGIINQESGAQTKPSGGGERVEREAVVGSRMERDGEWMRVAEWVHYPALPQQ